MRAQKGGGVLDIRFSHQQYLLRRKVFKLLGGAFHIYDPQGNLAFFCEQKGLKLKEDIRIYGDINKQTDLLRISARQVLDVRGRFDVFDSTTGEKVGVLERRMFKSVLRDEWNIYNANDMQIGVIQEESQALALIRRFLFNLIPQTFNASVNGQLVATFRQNFNPFVLKITIDFSPDPLGTFDRRLGICAAVLLAAVERRQQ